MCRNRHNCACTVTGKNVLTHPNRNLLAGKRINCIRTCEYTGNLTGLSHSLTLGLLLGLFQISLNSLFLLCSSKFLNPLALRSKNHECNSENCISTGGKDGHVVITNLEHHLSSLRFADPVLLHIFQ